MSQKIEVGNIPGALKALRRWVAWGPDPESGKPKCPLLISDRERRASTRKTETWSEWKSAAIYADRCDGVTTGVGYVFTEEDGLVYLDIDDCLDEAGAVRSWAAPFVEPFLGTAYMEQSPSGKGLHIITRGALPEGAVGGKANFPEAATGERVPEVAMFSTGKYTTITGRVWQGQKTIREANGAVAGVWEAAGIRARATGIQVAGEAPADDALPDVDARKVPRKVREEFEACRAAEAIDRSAARFQVYTDLAQRFTAAEIFSLVIQHAKWFAASGAEEKGREQTWLDINRSVAKVQTAKSEFEEVKEFSAAEEKKAHASWKDMGVAVKTRATKDGPVHDAVFGVFNIARVLSNHPEWKGRLRHNLFKDIIEIDGTPLKEVGLSKIAEFVRKVLLWDSEPQHNLVWAGILEAAEERAYNPVQDYLGSITWDGKSRCDAWLVKAGCEDTPLNRDIGKKWLISLVARALDPGCKVDTVLVLEGPQGKKKSTLLQAVAGGAEYFTDAHVGMDKDGMMVVHGAWVVELAELATMKRADREVVKQFISATFDDYRPPYARSVKRAKRHFVLTGSTNDNEYLNDPSGARRFWPVRAEADKLNVAWVVKWRDQLLAEAVALYKSGEVWWFEVEPEALLEAHAARFVEDPLTDKVDAFVEERRKDGAQPFTVGMVIERLGLQGDTRGTGQRIAEILKRRGLVKKRVRECGDRLWRWWKPTWPALVPEKEIDLDEVLGPVGGEPEERPAPAKKERE